MHTSRTHPSHPSPRRLCVALLLVVCFSGLHLAAAHGANAESDIRHVRVIWHEQPATSAVISWTSTTAKGDFLVRFGPQSATGKLNQYPSQVAAKVNDQFVITRSNEKEKLKDVCYHHAVLTGLKPSTRYYFTVIDQGQASDEFSFITAPADDRDFSILFGGDSKGDGTAEKDIAGMIREFIEKDENIIALAHGGDYLNSGDSLEQWLGALDGLERYATSDNRLLPIIPTRGNHDRGALFQQVFNFPGGKRDSYYTTQLAPAIALITLNTELSTAGDQRLWLDAELAKVRAKNRWVLAQYHRPAWPAVKKPSSALKDFVPLFEQHDVDLVLEADGHVIKRTPPIRDGKVDPTGVVYLGEGGLGVPQRKPDVTRWYLKEPGMAAAGHHIMKINFSPASIQTQFILLDGRRVLDEAMLKPRAKYAK